jgi:hypothetical protein
MIPPRARRLALVLTGTGALLLPLGAAHAWFRGGAWSGDRSSWNYHGARGTASGGDGSWSAQGYRGGSASGGGGSWSGSSYRGGTASGGDGSWHATGAAGGTASGGGGSWHATGAYGNTAYGGYNHYGGSYYYGYHPPVVTNSYYAHGCYNCGGWNTGAAWAAGVTGLAAGAAVGAAAASSASANAYAAGVAAGAAAATPAYVMNDLYAALPPGCTPTQISGVSYFRCGATWFAPTYGANGTFYRVVPAP